MWKNIEKDTTEIVYDNKYLHITELEEKQPVFILFYLLVIKDNNPATESRKLHNFYTATYSL
jgi:hypothetical protein